MGAGCARVVVPKDRRGLAKTEALLASDVSIVEMDELRSLILEGQERGLLTFEQITSCLEEVEVTKEQVVELHAYLEDQGIDIVNAEDGRPAIAEGGRFEPAAAQGKTPDAPPPNGKKLSGVVTLPGYNHIDVVNAAWHQAGGRPEQASRQLLRFGLRVVR